MGTPTVPWPPSTLTTLRPPPSIRRPLPRPVELTSPSEFTPLGLWCLMCMLPTLWSMEREMLMPSWSQRVTATDTPTHTESTERERLMPSLFTTLTALLPLMTPTLPLPPTHTLPPGSDTTDTLTYTERGRLSFPSTWSPDTPMWDTPTTDMAWLP